MSDAEAVRRVQEYLVATKAEPRSTHDLVRDLLAYCAGVSVPFERIYAVINAKVPQELEALLAVLQAYPYFVSSDEDGDDGWFFDPAIHRRVLTALAEGPAAPPGGGEPVRLETEAALNQAEPGSPTPERDVEKLAAPPRRPPAPQVELPPTATTVTREHLKRLLSMDPGRMMKLLDDLAADFWPISSRKEELGVAHGLGWYELAMKRLTLTRTGSAIYGLQLSDRADALRQQLRRLPAYVEAEEMLFGQGRLSADQLDAAVRALPADYRLDGERLYVWLGWIAATCGFGRADQTEITLAPELPLPPVSPPSPASAEVDAPTAAEPAAPDEPSQQTDGRYQADMRKAAAAVLLPGMSLSTDRMVTLVGLPPAKVIDVLDRLREGWPVPEGLWPTARMLAELKWTVSTTRGGQYTLTPIGRRLADLPEHGRAHVMRSLFQRLPAYLAAEEWLSDEGGLTRERAARLLARMHRENSVAAGENFFRWVGWVVAKLELGRAKGDALVAREGARGRLR